jgi:hypothetical protein
MALINYTQTDTAPSCDLSTAQFCFPNAGSSTVRKLAVDGGTAGTTTLTEGVTGSAADELGCRWEIAPAVGVSWDAGTWTVRLNVTASNMNLTWDLVYICRVDSSCVNQATIGSTTGLAISLSTIGVKTATVSGAAQTPTAGDLVQVILGFDNGSMNAQTFDVLSDQLIDSPFNDAPQLPGDPLPMVIYSGIIPFR